MSRSEEASEEDIQHATTLMQTYGWLIRSDAVGVTVAQEWRPHDGIYRDRTTIPRGMVVEEVMYALSKPRVRTKRRPESVPTVTS